MLSKDNLKCVRFEGDILFPFCIKKDLFDDDENVVFEENDICKI